jgi:heat shock protein HtpX
MESDALNAFATGLNQRQYAVTVTSGLLKALNDHEIEAVLGHELTHIRNGDVQMMVIAVIIAGAVGFFAELFFRMFTNFGWSSGGGRSSWSSLSSSSSSSSDSDRKGSGGGGAVVVIIIAVALIALAWLLSQLVRLALSRSRELLADAGSVELTKNPDAMISALRKIENRGELPGATSAVMELCVDNPREGFADLFATHPSVNSRVQALVKYAGGHGERSGPSAIAVRSLERCPGSRQRPAAGRVTRRVTGSLGRSGRSMGPPLGLEPDLSGDPRPPRVPSPLTTSAGLALTSSLMN